MKTSLLLLLFIGARVFTTTAWTQSQTEAGLAKAIQEDGCYSTIQRKVALHCPYRIGETLELRLPVGQAARIDCAENAYLVKECLVYASTSGTIWLIPVDVDGCLMRSSKGAPWRKDDGMLLGFPDSPCLAILEWEIEEQTLALRFRISADPEQNLRALRQRDPSADPIKGTMPLHSRAFPQVKLPECERVTGFVRLWSEVKYNFVSFDHVPEVDWDQVLVEYLPKVQKAETREDYFCVLARCLALLHDGHTDITCSGDRPHPGFGSYELPLRVQLLAGGQAVIVEVVPADAIIGPAPRAEFLKADLRPGEEVTQIDGRPVNQILERDIYPYICASTPQDRDLTAARWLLVGQYGSKAVLRIRNLAGNEREVTLTRKDFSYHKDYSPRPAPVNEFECRELDAGLVYINLPDFESDAVVRSFRAVLPKVLACKGLILDVRRNSGGDSANGDAIIGWLTDQPIAGERWKTRKYLPAFRAWGRKEQWHEEAGDPIQPAQGTRFLGPLVVLTGPATFSAAEDFVVPLHASKRATIVGERTGGSSGQPLPIELPFGGVARVCTKRDTYPDGREFVGVGVRPDVEIHPTPADIAAGHDVVLAKAVEVVKGLAATEEEQKPSPVLRDGSKPATGATTKR